MTEHLKHSEAINRNPEDPMPREQLKAMKEKLEPSIWDKIGKVFEVVLNVLDTVMNLVFWEDATNSAPLAAVLSAPSGVSQGPKTSSTEPEMSGLTESLEEVDTEVNRAPFK